MKRAAIARTLSDAVLLSPIEAAGFDIYRTAIPAELRHLGKLTGLVIKRPQDKYRYGLAFFDRVDGRSLELIVRHLQDKWMKFFGQLWLIEKHKHSPDVEKLRVNHP